MKKHYALKYMSKRRLVSKLVAQNVIRELEILQELSHPFIVNLWFTFQVTPQYMSHFKCPLG
jgi:serine/threonine kinase 32